MAIHAEPPTVTPARDLSPYRTDYTSWKIMAWTGFAFIIRVLLPVGAAGAQHLAVPAEREPKQVWDHYKNSGCRS